MPSKKKKYNARFPAGRIKKIMQSDEEVGKVAQAVPIIISRTLELFVQSMLEKTLRITNARNAKTLSPSHMKQCIMSESRFDFLRELVKNVPDINVAEEQLAADNYPDEPLSDSPPPLSIPQPQPPEIIDSDEPINLSISNGSHSSSRSATAMKRTTDTEHATAASERPWKFNKQHSLDSVADKLSISQNFYNSNSHNSNSTSSGSASSGSASNSSANKSIINFSIKYPTIKSGVGRPPKLQRVESTPNPMIPVTTTTLTANNQPIINFDFTKVPLASTSLMSDVSASLSLPSPTIVINSPHIKQAPPKTPIPELLKIGTSGLNAAPTKTITPSNHSVESLLQRPMRKTSTTIEPMPAHSRVTQPKYHHSHAQATTQQLKHLPSSSISSKPKYSAISSASGLPSATTSSSTIKTTAQHQTPVININFNNSSATPMISYSIPSTTISNSTSLEMDEDYDNI